MYNHNDYEESIQVAEIHREGEPIRYNIIVNGKTASMVDNTYKCVIIERDAGELKDLAKKILDLLEKC